MEGKKAEESRIIMTEIVLPNDTNVFGNLMGVLDGYCSGIGCAKTL
jgi:acyl-CoA hydrolase